MIIQQMYLYDQNYIIIAFLYLLKNPKPNKQLGFFLPKIWALGNRRVLPLKVDNFEGMQLKIVAHLHSKSVIL